MEKLETKEIKIRIRKNFKKKMLSTYKSFCRTSVSLIVFNNYDKVSLFFLLAVLSMSFLQNLAKFIYVFKPCY